MDINMFSIGAAIIIISAIIIMYALFRGPTFFDRVLTVNLLGTKTIVLLLLFGYIFERPHFADLALVYAIINLVGTIVVLKASVDKTLT